MQWLINIMAAIVIVIVVLLVLAVICGCVMALYAKIKHGQPFFKTWWAKFKSVFFDLFLEALIPFNWF
ncbi:hypothetical protein [Vagococcus zengguangii]|uniref:Uncharacterized protein n=1 Tax=Vagococcus zengguangii TaxID=2571750 RepID=A0A4D7CSV2_9ENTE|nr:hypothetical protein [Vagococcus zengguangii]QCI87249.1 hypothetical protein FA707_10050 [Vagococcus zengguangii]TLG80753.1 hypothetical protein FE258_04665 [Vagococcus zengguangii]